MSLRDFLGVIYRLEWLNQIKIETKVSPKPIPKLGAEIVVFPISPSQPPGPVNLPQNSIIVKRKYVCLRELDP